ncbi:hypothetical protein [Methanosarcina mazei]|nr:hypothetical protein [Methanosarcina mazei]
MNIYEEFNPYACKEHISGLKRQDLDLDEEQEGLYWKKNIKNLTV